MASTGRWPDASASPPFRPNRPALCTSACSNSSSTERRRARRCAPHPEPLVARRRVARVGEPVSERRVVRCRGLCRGVVCGAGPHAARAPWAVREPPGRVARDVRARRALHRRENRADPYLPVLRRGILAPLTEKNQENMRAQVIWSLTLCMAPPLWEARGPEEATLLGADRSAARPAVQSAGGCLDHA